MRSEGTTYLLIRRMSRLGIDMNPPEAQRPDQDDPPPKLSRLEVARRMIEEYAADLREIIKKLKRKFN